MIRLLLLLIMINLLIIITILRNFHNILSNKYIDFSKIIKNWKISRFLLMGFKVGKKLIRLLMKLLIYTRRLLLMNNISNKKQRLQLRRNREKNLLLHRLHLKKLIVHRRRRFELLMIVHDVFEYLFIVNSK